MTYKVELIDRKDPLAQLEASKLSINDSFYDLLNETKGFTYQVTLKILLKKCRINEIKFSPVYFNSATKTVINNKFVLDGAFREILCSIENWINEESGWVIESIQSQCINISTYRPLFGSSYVSFPPELEKSKKGYINIKNDNQNYLSWCHISSPIKIHPEITTRFYKKLINDIDYKGIDFSVSKKDFSRIEVKNCICINIFCYEEKLTYSTFFS